MDAQERIRYVIDAFEGGNSASFAQRVGISKYAVSRMCTGKSSVTPHAAAIVKSYPLVSMAWLLTGEGKPPLTLSELERVERIAEKLHGDLGRLKERLDEVERTHREIMEMYNKNKNL